MLPLEGVLIDLILAPIRGIAARVEHAIEVIWWQGFWTGFLAGLAGAVCFLLLLSAISRR